MFLSGMNPAISAVGFGVLYKKLAQLDKTLNEIKGSVDGIVRLLELDERAKLIFALQQLSLVMKNGPPGTREQQFLHEVLNVFGPVKVKYRGLLPEATVEAAMACQEYFTLTSLATVACWAELGRVDTARDNLKYDYTFWVEQARRIADENLLGKHPERFLAGEFVSDVSLSELAAWLNFARDENRSEQERIDELRERIHLDADGKSRIRILRPRETRTPKASIEEDKKKIHELRKLVACNGVFQGYLAQYELLNESRMTPSAFQQKIDALDRAMVVDGYVIRVFRRICGQNGGLVVPRQTHSVRGCLPAPAAWG